MGTTTNWHKLFFAVVCRSGTSAPLFRMRGAEVPKTVTYSPLFVSTFMPYAPLLLRWVNASLLIYTLTTDCLLFIAKGPMGGGLPAFLYLCLFDPWPGKGKKGLGVWAACWDAYCPELFSPPCRNTKDRLIPTFSLYTEHGIPATESSLFPFPPSTSYLSMTRWSNYTTTLILLDYCVPLLTPPSWGLMHCIFLFSFSICVNKIIFNKLWGCWSTKAWNKIRYCKWYKSKKH